MTDLNKTIIDICVEHAKGLIERPVYEGSFYEDPPPPPLRHDPQDDEMLTDEEMSRIKENKE